MTSYGSASHFPSIDLRSQALLTVYTEPDGLGDRVSLYQNNRGRRLPYSRRLRNGACRSHPLRDKSKHHSNDEMMLKKIEGVLIESISRTKAVIQKNGEMDLQRGDRLLAVTEETIDSLQSLHP